jgi:hypothetical protein
MIDRISHFREREVVKNMVSVVVKDPEIILLVKVTHDHVKMLAVLFLYKVFIDLIGDVFFYPL